MAENKGGGYPNHPFEVSPPVPFWVREVSEQEAQESLITRKAHTDAQIEHLEMEAAIVKRMAEIRQQADRTDR